ncbi:MAG TPA: hypothetical protein VM012_13110 [Flavitalea sp.]|nr:hypothetical protein [Flavitalea sp.]
MENTLTRELNIEKDNPVNKEENIADRYTHINGWGMDADPENEPTYPMKKYTGDDHKRSNYQRPVQQVSDVEKLHSNERPTLSAVYGTTLPPTGLSGMLRRYAFKHSENSSKHWFSLVLADRINVIEGIVDDLKRGHIPNLIAERGWSAEWKYNRKGLVQKLAVTAVVVVGIIAFFSRKNKLQSSRD